MYAPSFSETRYDRWTDDTVRWYFRMTGHGLARNGEDGDWGYLPLVIRVKVYPVGARRIVTEL